MNTPTKKIRIPKADLQPTDSYSLDSSYYTKSFGSIDALIEDVQSSGMDPNAEVLKNGKRTGEKLFDLMEI